MTVALNAEPGPRPSKDSLRAVVNDKGEIELVACDVLAAHFLRAFGHGEIRIAWVHLGHDLPVRAILSCETRPILSDRGGDPFTNGIPLSPAEARACAELVDRMRSQQSEPNPAAPKPKVTKKRKADA